jgi:hypothetical protein
VLAVWHATTPTRTGSTTARPGISIASPAGGYGSATTWASSAVGLGMASPGSTSMTQAHFTRLSRSLWWRLSIALTALCWFGAIANAAQTFVSVNAGGGVLRVRPRTIHVLSNENLYQLRWSSWGGFRARANGIDHSNFPSAGRSAQNPVRVELRGRKRCGSRLVYTRLRIRFTNGIPYAGEPSLISYSYGCPPYPPAARR